jgi:hypothetical protein
MGRVMMPSYSIGSVVIPAHNEAAVIRRCLDALLVGFVPGELDVVVACNGCTDGTGDIVRSSWPTVRVVEVERASKPAALQAADEVLSVFPRLYLDADVILPATSARLIVEHLRVGPALAARPPISYDVSGADALVRSYYRARGRMFYLKNTLWAAAGVYALSASGRARFGSYPDVIADDLFAGQWFEPSEIDIVGSAPAIVTVPRRTRDLFRVLRRRYQGNVEIHSIPDHPKSTVRSTLHDLAVTAASGPGAAVDAATFMGIAAAVRITRLLSPPAGWARDESSREAAAASM